MPDEFTPPGGGPTHYHDERQSPQYQDRRELLRTYGPSALGIIVVLLLLVAGWYLFRGRVQNNRPQQTIQASFAPLATLSPEVSPGPILNNLAPSPASPLPSLSPLPKGDAAATTKGGLATDSAKASQLPQTGFPTGLAITISGLAVLFGLKLRTLKQ